MTLQSDFNKGFHGQIPDWLKTKDKDEPDVRKKKTKSKKK